MTVQSKGKEPTFLPSTFDGDMVKHTPEICKTWKWMVQVHDDHVEEVNKILNDLFMNDKIRYLEEVLHD